MEGLELEPKEFWLQSLCFKAFCLLPDSSTSWKEQWEEDKVFASGSVPEQWQVTQKFAKGHAYLFHPGCRR